MSVSNILGENGIILPQFLPTIAPPVSFAYACYYGTSNTSITPGQSMLFNGGAAGPQPPAATGGITKTTTTTNLSAADGDVITLPAIGTYQVSYNVSATATSPQTAQVLLAAGSDANHLAELEYTNIAAYIGTNAVTISGTFLVETASTNSAITFIKDSANLGNFNPINTSISILQVA